MAKKPSKTEPEEFKGDSNTALAARSAPQVPAWMQDKEIEGKEDLSKYQSTPRIGIVQTNSKSERKEAVGEGGVAILPDVLPVAEAEEEFVVVPILFYPTWEKWSDYNDKTSETILETSYDEGSKLARLAKNKQLRKQPYEPSPGQPAGFFYQYVESLNFLVMIDSGPHRGMVAALSFNRGAHYVGEKLSGLIDRRPCSIYANRISLKSVLTSRGDEEWYQFEINNPEGEPFVSEGEYEKYKTLHATFKELLESKGIGINREDEQDDASFDPSGMEEM